MRCNHIRLSLCHRFLTYFTETEECVINLAHVFTLSARVEGDTGVIEVLYASDPSKCLRLECDAAVIDNVMDGFALMPKVRVIAEVA